MFLFGFILLIFLGKNHEALTQLLPVTTDEQHISGYQLQKYLEVIYKEQAYELIFFLRENSKDCIDENLPSLFKVSTIILNTEQSFYLKANFTSELLAVVCIRTAEHLKLLDILAKNMQHMRYKRLLVLNNEDYRDLPGKENLKAFFRRCMQLKLLQVNVVHRDFRQTGIYHSYTQFPAFELEQQSLHSSEGLTLYPERLKDMKGKIVLTLPDQVEPRSMLYTDKTGKQRITGYIGKLITAFATHYNCSLRFPYEITEGSIIYNSAMRPLTRNETIDIGISLSTSQRELNTHEYTYPVEVARWLVMVPIEREVPKHLLLLSVFNVEFLLFIVFLCWLLSVLLTLHLDRRQRYNCEGISLLNLVCNESILRGMLGQPFKLQKRANLGLKCAYFLIFVAGFFIGTIFSSNLVRLFTAPPTIKQITTFDDVMEANLKIVLHDGEVANIIYFNGKEFWEKYQSIFEIVKSNKEYREIRMSFNKSAGFGIVSSNWPPIAVQQNYFERTLYRLEPKLFFTDMLLFGLPVNENSIYKDPLNRFILQLRASGIFDHWFANTFYDMVELGRITFKDLSTTRNQNALQLEDFYWIWVLYVGGVSICCLVFLLELLLYHKFKWGEMNGMR